MRTLNRRFAMQKALPVLVFGLATIASATHEARADSTKPKETPTETVSLKFGKTEITYSIDGSEGPGVVVEGTLHVASQALLSSDGTPIGFTLHTNLSDAFAESLDGATAYVAVGASDGIPQECQPTGCPPPLWTVTFRLLPLNPGSRSSLLFDATLKTRYAADGTLVNVCVVGQEDCDTNDIP